MNDLNTKIKDIYFKNKAFPNLLTRYPSVFIFNKIGYTKVELDYQDTSNGNLLYIHVPFCFSICNFCNLYKIPFQSIQQVDNYIDVLIEELQEISSGISGEISCFWIGGGTPNILSDSQCSRLFKEIFRLFKFKKDYHFELDIHPAFIRDSTLKIYRDFGVKLLSIGIQSFDKSIIEMANRGLQNKISLERQLSKLMKYEFNVHLDFIVGLPGDNMIDDDYIEIDKLLSYTKIFSISINKYENSFNTQLFKDGFKVTQKENELKLKRVRDLENYIFKNYSLKREESPFIEKFFTNRYNVLASGAGAFGYLRGEGVYRNALYKEYLRSTKSKKFYSFDIIDEKIMYVVNNSQRKELSLLYLQYFGSYLYDDFFDFFKELDKRFYSLNDKHIILTFPSNDLAALHLVKLYYDRISKYYE